MKNGPFTLVLLAVFLFGTGAAIIDRETKESIVGLNAKFGRLADEGRAHHVEQMKILKGQQEIVQKLERRIELLERRIKAAPAATTTPAAVAPAPEVPPAAPVVEPVQAAPTPEPLPPIKTAEEEVPPPADQFVPAVPVALPAPTNDNAQSLAILASLISGIAIVLLIVLLVRMKQGEDRKRQISWNSEIDSLRDEMIRGRPHLKILSEGEKVEVLNAGETVAEEVKVFVGPAASSMKQKLKVAARVPAGEKTRIELPGQLSEDPLYATLEYKNPSTGRTYKEQYVLKLDRVTGHLSPLAQGV